MNNNEDKEEPYKIEITEDKWYIASIPMGSKMKLQQYGQTKEEAEEKLDKLIHPKEKE
jgi:hypothetical protein